jgi:hypothetical protein
MFFPGVDTSNFPNQDLWENLQEGRTCWNCDHLLVDDGNFCQCYGEKYNQRVSEPTATTCRDWEKYETSIQ